MMRHLQPVLRPVLVILLAIIGLLWLTSYLSARPVKKKATAVTKVHQSMAMQGLLHHQHAPHIDISPDDEGVGLMQHDGDGPKHINSQTKTTKQTIAIKNINDFNHFLLQNQFNNDDDDLTQLNGNENDNQFPETTFNLKSQFKNKYQDFPKTNDLYNQINSQCTPKKNIVFFKTHKCATSTVQNIMFRYGDKHQLKFVLPRNRNDHRFSLKTPFERRRVLTSGRRWSPQEQFNIFTSHAIFNKEELEAVMPPDTIYVSILRDPIKMFESLYTYERFDHRFSYNDSIHLISLEEFLDHSAYYYSMKHIYGRNFTRNPMFYDFGLTPHAMDDINKINNLLSVIDQRFDLIMIADYFDESLIMLKHLLCLDMLDIAYLTFNARSDESIHTISDSVAKKISKWNWADALLYEHFNRTFHEKLAQFDPKVMKREKQELKKLNEQLQEFCVADIASDMESVWHPEGVKIEGFKLKEDQKDEDGICKMLTRPEKVYTDVLRDRQSSDSFQN